MIIVQRCHMKIKNTVREFIRTHPFLKWVFLNYLPIWGFILWLHFRLIPFLDPSTDGGYWIANLSASTIYILVTYPLVKLGVFNLKWK